MSRMRLMILMFWSPLASFAGDDYCPLRTGTTWTYGGSPLEMARIVSSRLAEETEAIVKFSVFSEGVINLEDLKVFQTSFMDTPALSANPSAQARASGVDVGKTLRPEQLSLF